jgi:hypothetical protein
MSYKFAYYASAIAPNGEAVGKKTNKRLTHCVVGRKEWLFGERRIVGVDWRPVAWSTSVERAQIRASSARSGYDELAIVEVELWNLNN